MIRIIPPRPLRRGKRVHLHPPAANLKPLYLKFLAENREFHAPWVYHSDDDRHFDYYLKRIKSGQTQGCFIFDNASEDLVGVVNINNILLGAIRSASLGYFGAERFTGQGLFAEGMALVLQYVFTDLGLNRVEANIQPGNEPSLKLVKRLGFRKEGFSPKFLQIGGEWCDHERWAILGEEFLK